MPSSAADTPQRAEKTPRRMQKTSVLCSSAVCVSLRTVPADLFPTNYSKKTHRLATGIVHECQPEVNSFENVFVCILYKSIFPSIEKALLLGNSWGLCNFLHQMSVSVPRHPQKIGKSIVFPRERVQSRIRSGAKMTGHAIPWGKIGAGPAQIKKPYLLRRKKPPNPEESGGFSGLPAIHGYHAPRF